MAINQPPPRRKSARLRATGLPNIAQPTRPPGPIQLPLDIVHSIFEYYVLGSVSSDSARHTRVYARNYHRCIAHFAGVCQIWHAAAFGQLCYVIHDRDADSNEWHRQTTGRKRIEELMKLLDSREFDRTVKHFSFKTFRGTMEDTSALVQVVNAVQSTLTTFRLHLSTPNGKVYKPCSAGDHLWLLAQSLGGADKLKELELRVKMWIPCEDFLILTQSANSHCTYRFDLDPLAVAPRHAGKETIDWRTIPLPPETPWHHLTTLFISCTTFSVPLIAVILTSETVKHLHLIRSELTREIPTYDALQELWEAIEYYGASLISFTNDFVQRYEISNTPPLDRVIPSLTSCTDLAIGAADLGSMGPLLSLTALKSLKIFEISSGSERSSGLRIIDLLAFLRQGKGVLECLEVTIEPDIHDSRSEETEDLDKLAEEARGLDIDFYVEEMYGSY